MAGFSHSEQPVIAFTLALFRLLAFDHAKQARFHQASGKNRLVHQGKNVNWVSIVTLGGRDEAKIVREDHSFRQHFLQREHLLRRVPRVLVAAPF